MSRTAADRSFGLIKIVLATISARSMVGIVGKIKGDCKISHLS